MAAHDPYLGRLEAHLTALKKHAAPIREYNEWLREQRRIHPATRDADASE
jgi:hypothetical protein